MWLPALGAIAAGIGGYLDPAALGVGYGNIAGLLHDRFNLQDAGALLIGKATVWIVSSGTSGGVLALLLIITKARRGQNFCVKSSNTMRGRVGRT